MARRLLTEAGRRRELRLANVRLHRREAQERVPTLALQTLFASLRRIVLRAPKCDDHQRGRRQTEQQHEGHQREVELGAEPFRQQMH
jgi:hypothetical protein